MSSSERERDLPLGSPFGCRNQDGWIGILFMITLNMFSWYSGGGGKSNIRVNVPYILWKLLASNRSRSCLANRLLHRIPPIAHNWVYIHFSHHIPCAPRLYHLCYLLVLDLPILRCHCVLPRRGTYPSRENTKNALPYSHSARTKLGCHGIHAGRITWPPIRSELDVGKTIQFNNKSWCEIYSTTTRHRMMRERGTKCVSTCVIKRMKVECY